MARILVIFAHPALEKSRVQKEMVSQAQNIKGVLLHDLYELYPDFDIDVKAEQKLLLAHDIIVLQHPFYWYSCPAIIKQWEDLVLEHNWAYGHLGNMLRGKKIFNAISIGGGAQAYTATGRNRFTIPELLRPFEQTALLCKMNYLPPFVIHGTHKLQSEDVREHAKKYRQLLLALAEDKIEEEKFSEIGYMNDLVDQQSIET
jgi:glutathione-regulated potassium-efflux system ancillary protein KefG